MDSPWAASPWAAHGQPIGGQSEPFNGNQCTPKQSEPVYLNNDYLLWNGQSTG
ncbi:unnamed protein product [Ectocarpus sp. CCAP 1310/34]|nr:unnamed protein product [Ectocarpus sp. CCAP 1310/34]